MKTENRISAAFDAASPDELEALLEGVDTENVDRITAKRIEKAVLKKVGADENKAARAARRPRLRRIFAAAAALVVVLGAVLGGTAYAQEAKEYKEAVAFFNANNLPTEGLSRKDIKEVYRDIITNSFTNSKTEGVILAGQSQYRVPGHEFSEHPAAPMDIQSIWQQQPFFSIPESEDEYLVSAEHGGLIDLYDNGKHYRTSVEYAANTDSIEFGSLLKYRKNELERRVDFKYSWIDSFEVFDDCEIIIGYRSSFGRDGIGFIAKNDENGLDTRYVGKTFSDSVVKSIVRENDGSFTVFSMGFEAANTGIIRVLLCSSQLSEMSEMTIDCPEGYYLDKAIRFGSGYALLVQAKYMAWLDSGGSMPGQIVMFADRDGNITDSLSLSLDDEARETLEAREITEGAENDPASIFSIGLDDCCFVIEDMIEYGGKLYFSGYSLPSGGFQNGHEPNPSSGHDEIMPLINEVFGSGHDMSEAEFTELVRDCYTAMLIEVDPAGAEPVTYYLEAGALGNALRTDADGELIWDVCSMTRAVFSPATNAFSMIYNTDVYEYRFNGNTVVGVTDTGARFSIMR